MRRKDVNSSNADAYWDGRRVLTPILGADFSIRARRRIDSAIESNILGGKAI